MPEEINRQNKVTEDTKSVISYLHRAAQHYAVQECKNLPISDKILIGRASLEYFKTCVAVPFFIHSMISGQVGEKWLRLFTSPNVEGEHILSVCKNALMDMDIFMSEGDIHEEAHTPHYAESAPPAPTSRPINVPDLTPDDGPPPGVLSHKELSGMVLKNEV
jgi:hypothetical protein